MILDGVAQLAFVWGVLLHGRVVPIGVSCLAMRRPQVGRRVQTSLDDACGFVSSSSVNLNSLPRTQTTPKISSAQAVATHGV